MFKKLIRSLYQKFYLVFLFGNIKNFILCLIASFRLMYDIFASLGN